MPYALSDRGAGSLHRKRAFRRKNRKMNRLPGIGLRGEIALNLFLFVVMMLIMMAFLLFDVSREGIAVQRIEDKRGLVESIRDNLERALDSNSDLSELVKSGSLLESLRSYCDGGLLKEARLFSVDGKNLLRVGSGTVPEESRVVEARNAMENQKLVTRIEKDSGGLFKESWGQVVISTPVRSGEEVVGGLQIVSAITDARDGVLYYNWHVLILLVIFSMLIVAVISYSLGHEVVNPIEEIVKATQRVREGDLEQRLTVKSGNEIGKLAQSFNEMVGELQENRRSVTQYVKSLKDVNSMLKQAEHRVIRTEKLATIGRLAAGVAHEVGNPLGALYGYLEVLKKKVSGEEAQSLLRMVEKETNQINEIIFGLLDLSRQGKGKNGTIKVNDLIEKTIALLTSQNALSGINSQLHLKLTVPEVKGDPRELQQALINLLANSIDAMPAGGILTIRTGVTTYHSDYAGEGQEQARREGDPLDLDFSPLRRNGKSSLPVVSLKEGQGVVYLEVSDTGKGIKREHLSRIFDPFFTLKDKEKGTGLGLSICDRIIRGMGGVIRVESVWGKGSKFMFYLPVAGSRANSSAEADGEKKELDSRSES